MLLRDCEFHKKWCSESHALRRGISEFYSILCTCCLICVNFGIGDVHVVLVGIREFLQDGNGQKRHCLALESYLNGQKCKIA
jgi:hypothetical protein